jgi:ATP-binding cassette subfamily C exporter for protease/lipase
LPWIPLYVGVLFAFEWPLGLLAVVGMLLLIIIAILTEKLTQEPLAESSKIASQAAFMLNKQHRNIEIISALGMIPVLGKRWQAQNRQALLLQIQASDYMARLSAIGRYIRLTLAIFGIRRGRVFGIKRPNVGRYDDCRFDFVRSCACPCRAIDWLMETTDGRLKRASAFKSIVSRR